MTDILDQPDNDLDVYGDTEIDPRYSERDVLGDDDETDVLKNDNNNGAQNGGNGDVVIVKSEANDSDLYDAAIEPSGQHGPTTTTVASPTKSPAVSRQASSSSQLPTLGLSNPNSGGRRYCCYIGNMTWWTTDVDLQSLILSVGATDLIDIKFYENRNNGQSRGFALAVFTAENAVKIVMEKLPHKTLHGQQVVVLPYTKASLAKFEDATRSRDQQRTEKKDAKKEEQKAPFVGTIRIGVPPQQPQPQIQPAPMSLPPPMSLRPQVQVPPPMTNMRPPAQVPLMIPQQQPPQMRGPPPTTQPLNLANLTVPARPPVNLSAPPPGIPQVQLGAGAPPMTRPPPGFGQPPQAMQSLSNAGPTHPPLAGAPPTSHPPPSFPPPGAHINPQVYRQNFALFTYEFEGGGPAPVPSTMDGLSDAEFEEIMNRNRTVSSSAITRAVSDAAANDYASAIETLVTAISLIRQSRVANDDRCKVLISSLQDTLNGIENKSYNSSSRKHRSARDRSRSPSERSRKRHRRSSRSRSRSRERYDYSPRHSSSSNRRAY
ncbi:unnamed protein product [Dracunculus medinensis]|uniref:RRM domain-containing protein n=1 Tax=Dracunculus medinensis TaxID=318479 RepID=A0A0N4U464_DRAME|nr:unnamed protein product [Dracunculus medinensis]